MRLIDGDALLEQMKHRKEYVGRPSDPVCLVEDAPTVQPDAPRVLTWEELIYITDPVWYEERDGLSSWALCTDVTLGNAYEDMSYEFFKNYDNSYIREYADKCNVYWRCWSAKSSKEQMEATPWID